MKITVKKVKAILKEEYEWENLDFEEFEIFSSMLIKDVITIVTKSLKDKK